MTRADKEESEAIAELNRIAARGDESLDVEGSHVESAGYPDLAEAFRNACRVRGFWYA